MPHLLFAQAASVCDVRPAVEVIRYRELLETIQLQQ
jgi:hypothetical protein